MRPVNLLSQWLRLANSAALSIHPLVYSSGHICPVCAAPLRTSNQPQQRLCVAQVSLTAGHLHTRVVEDLLQSADASEEEFLPFPAEDTHPLQAAQKKHNHIQVASIYYLHKGTFLNIQI